MANNKKKKNFKNKENASKKDNRNLQKAKQKPLAERLKELQKHYNDNFHM